MLKKPNMPSPEPEPEMSLLNFTNITDQESYTEQRNKIQRILLHTSLINFFPAINKRNALWNGDIKIYSNATNVLVQYVIMTHL